MRRHALGIIAIGLLAAGVVILWQAGINDSQTSMIASICLRAGLVLGAIWLAFPQVLQIFRRFPPWLLISVAVGGLIVIARPRLIVVVGPVLAAIAVLQFIGWLFKPLPQNKRSRTTQRKR